MPEELVRANGEVGVEKDFQATFLTRDITLESTIGQSSSRRGKRMERNIKDWLLDKRECECGGRADGLHRPIERMNPHLEMMGD